jgi:predicted alpha/beta hydrolase family esterase
MTTIVLGDKHPRAGFGPRPVWVRLSHRASRPARRNLLRLRTPARRRSPSRRARTPRRRVLPRNRPPRLAGVAPAPGQLRSVFIAGQSYLIWPTTALRQGESVNRMIAEQILIVPGRGGSGPEHWQSLWTDKYSARRVEHREWNAPIASEWIETFDEAMAACSAPPVIVAHSLGCMLIARWAGQRLRPVKAAMLVAPPDVESDTHTPPEAHVFRPIPMRPLPFSSVVVASSNDPRCNIDRARLIAKAWGADFRDVGEKGHINIASGFGPWAEGEQILTDLLARLPSQA